MPLTRRTVFLLVLLAIALAAPPLCFAEPTDETARHLKDMHHHPWFLEVLAASVTGWVIGLVKGFSGTKDWLAGYWPNPPRVLVFALDLIVFVGVGAYFGTGIYNPANFLAAVGAGLTWPIGLGSLATK